MRFLGFIDGLMSLVFITILIFTLAFTIGATYVMYNLAVDQLVITKTKTHIVYAKDCWDDIHIESV